MGGAPESPPDVSADAVFERDEVAKTLVVLAARGAPLQVLCEAGQPSVSVRAGQFELDVLVEQFEALLTRRFGPRGSE
jgi:hypothetical protein